MNFYSNYLKLCNLKCETPSRAALNCGISKAAVNRWKNGYLPTDANLQKLADYFGVTTDYLLTGKERTATENDDGLNAELISLFSRIPEDQQQAALSYLRFLVDNQ